MRKGDKHKDIHLKEIILHLTMMTRSIAVCPAEILTLGHHVFVLAVME
jgi:hypothetical protein